MRQLCVGSITLRPVFPSLFSPAAPPPPIFSIMYASVDMKLMSHLEIKESRIPKYRQIVDGVIEGVTNGHLQIDEKIPSINALSESYGLSRDTVEKLIIF